MNMNREREALLMADIIIADPEQTWQILDPYCENERGRRGGKFSEREVVEHAFRLVYERAKAIGVNLDCPSSLAVSGDFAYPGWHKHGVLPCVERMPRMLEWLAREINNREKLRSAA